MAVWQRMLSGRRLDLLDPSPLDIEIADIAHGLARIARWNGQTSGTWAMSVAEHSVLVERIVALLTPDLGAEPRLAALLHDGHEYVVGDMIGPLKRATGPGRRELEDRLQGAIHARFGLRTRLPRDLQRRIRSADRASAHLEAIHVGEYSPAEARRLWGPLPGPVAGVELRTPLPPPDAEAAFLSRFAALSSDAGAPPHSAKAPGAPESLRRNAAVEGKGAR